MTAAEASNPERYRGHDLLGSPARDVNLPIFPSFKALSSLKLALNFIILNYNICTAKS